MFIAERLPPHLGRRSEGGTQLERSHLVSFRPPTALYTHGVGLYKHLIYT